MSRLEIRLTLTGPSEDAILDTVKFIGECGLPEDTDSGTKVSVDGVTVSWTKGSLVPPGGILKPFRACLYVNGELKDQHGPYSSADQGGRMGRSYARGLLRDGETGAILVQVERFDVDLWKWVPDGAVITDFTAK